MDSARRAVLPLVAGLVAVAALGVWWVQPIASEFRGWVTFAAIFAVTWPVIGFAGGIRQGFWALSLVLDAAKQWRGRVGASWIGGWGAVVGVAWIPRVAWVLVCALAGAVADRAGDARGSWLGWQQSAGAGARVVGPLMAGALFEHVGVGAPYALAAGLTVVALALVPA